MSFPLRTPGDRSPFLPNTLSPFPTSSLCLGRVWRAWEEKHSMTVPGKERKLKVVPLSTCTHNTDLPGKRDGKLGQACPFPPLVFKKKGLVLGGQVDHGHQVNRSNVAPLFRSIINRITRL